MRHLAASSKRTEDGASPCASNHKEMRHLAVSHTGRVVRIADGDTLTILSPAAGTTGVSPVAQHKIRLYGIDAPEKSQAFGAASKHHLSSLVFGKDVRVKYKSRDKYGRILGTVYVDGKDVNLEMIRAGLAWHYKRFDSTPAYAAAESEAQIDFCGKAWDSAGDIQEIRNSTNTKVSYEAAFQFFHRQLAKLGVESVDDFKSIIRAHQARELRRHQREKSAAQSNTRRGKNGII